MFDYIHTFPKKTLVPLKFKDVVTFLAILLFFFCSQDSYGQSKIKKEYTEDVIEMYSRYSFDRIPWMTIFNDIDIDPQVVVRFFNEKSKDINLQRDYKKISKRFVQYQELMILKRPFEVDLKRLNRKRNSRNTATGNWQYIGKTPSSFQTNNGRIERINFHPTNENIIWASAPEGGLWRTIDGGNTWTTSSDFWDHLGTGDLVYDQNNNNILYLAADDPDSQFTFNRGVLKSTDGGNTWNVIGLDNSLASSVFKLGIQPDGSSLYACTSSGLFTSVDGGVTWVKNAGLPSNIQINDLEYHPTNSNIIYAAERGMTLPTGAPPGIMNTNYFYISTDGGLSWSNPTMPFDSEGRTTQVEVSPDNPDLVYIGVYPDLSNQFAGVLVQKYVHSTGNITAISNPAQLFSHQIPGAWDFRIEVNPSDADHIIYGNVDGVETTDGGTTWVEFNNLHSDYHDIKWQNTTSGTKLWVADDGGVGYTLDGGASWTAFSNIPVLQPAFNASSDDGTIFIVGSQDAGNQFDINGNYFFVPGGGDGLRCIVDPVDNNTIYYSVQQGLEIGKIKFNPTNNTFQSNSIMNQSIGGSIVPWSVPVLIDKEDHNTLYTGFADVWRSTDQGANWTNISSGGFGNGGSSRIEFLVQSQSHPDVIYGAHGGGLVKSTDRGNTWTSLPGAPIFINNRFTSFVIHPNNPDSLWSINGALDGVVQSIDGGLNWTNVPGTLPSSPFYSIAYQDGTDNGIYISGSFGELWYIDDNLTDWQQHDQNLPNVWTRNIEILPLINKIRVSTWGRGIWEGDTYVNSVNPCDPPDLPQIMAAICLADATLNIDPTPVGYGIKWYRDGIEIVGETSTSLITNTPGVIQAKYYANSGFCHSYLSEKVDVQFVTTNVYYQDNDGDGFGNPNVTTNNPCLPGYVEIPNDCDDINPNINPYGIEICGNMIDEDCDNSPDLETNRGLDFDGVDDHLTFNNFVSYNKPFTVELWVKPQDISGNRILWNWYNSNGHYARLFLTNNGKVNYFEYDGANTDGWNASSSNIDTWYHLAVVREGNNVTVYRDGTVLFSRSDFNLTLSLDFMIMGKDPFQDIFYYDGVMDDIRVWDIALTSTQIQNRMNLRLDGTETNLIAYYPLDHGTPGSNNAGINIGIDKSGVNNATLNNFELNTNNSNWVLTRPYPVLYADDDSDGFGDLNSPWTCGSMTNYVTDTNDCDDSDPLQNPYGIEDCGNLEDDDCDGQVDIEVNKALDFDGTDDNLSVISSFNYTNPLTIEFWSKTDMNTSGNWVVFHWHDGNGKYAELQLATGKPVYYENDGTVQGWTLNNLNFNDDMWHHYAIVRNGSQFILYVDGVLQWDRNDWNKVLSLDQLLIGVNSGNFDYYNGLLDEFRVWNTALSLPEITDRMNRELDGDESGLMLYYPMDHGIPGSNNDYLTLAKDRSQGNKDAALNGFLLNGSSSNWVTGQVFPTWYLDFDGDGYGDQNNIWTCGPMSSYVMDNTDCNDSLPGINPGETETWYDGTDSNCDGKNDYDQDMDGYVGIGYEAFVGGTAPLTGDCDDTNNLITPAVTETWYDGVDSNCDGLNDYDQDEDGYVALGYEAFVGGTALLTGDCDDVNNMINPGLNDTWYDGVDTNCDGLNDYDQDMDGYVANGYEAFAGGTAPYIGDCNDMNDMVNPYAVEECANNEDDDCDGNLNTEVNKALHFNGGNQHLSFASIPPYSITFTLEFWIKTAQVTGFKDVMNWGAVGSDHHVRISLNQGGILLALKDDNIDFARTTSGKLSSDTWHHVAIVKNGNNVKIYIDGTEELNDSGFNQTPIVDQYFVGGYDGVINNFTGALDEIRIWNTALTQLDINDRKNRKLDGSESNLIAYFPLDHGIPGQNNAPFNRAIDRSLQSYDAVLNNFALNGMVSNWILSRPYPNLYADTDMDGYGDPNNEWTCGSMVGYIEDDQDCDDSMASVNPDLIWYADTDIDTYGDPNSFIMSCTQPVGYVLDNTDCDDTRNYVYPGAPEDPTNMIDDNCNMIVDEAPEIIVSGGSPLIEIVNGDNTPSSTDHTDFGTQLLSTNFDRVFKIENIGNLDLNLTGSPDEVILTGSPYFSVIQQPVLSTLGNGVSTTFTVRYNPLLQGIHTAIVNIPNNDFDENPYTFTIQGKVCDLAITNVLVEDETCPNAADGRITVTASCTNCTGNISYSIDGNNFQSSNVFENLIDGNYTVTVKDDMDNVCEISSGGHNINPGSDSQDPTFTRPVDRNVDLDGQCNIAIPNLLTEITDETDNCGTVNLSQVPMDGAIISSSHNMTHTVMITADDGNGNSNIQNVTLTAKDNSDPTFTCPSSRDITLNASCELTVPDLISEILDAQDNCVNITPTQDILSGTILSSGDGMTHDIIITADDGNGNSVQCTVVLTGRAPEMVVEGGNPSQEISNLDFIPDVADGTDFGSQLIGSNTDHIFAIKNTGGASLILDPPPLVSISGDSEFSVLSQPGNTIITSGGNDLTFLVRYAPAAAGNHTATLSISNNDCDENPYTFTISGNVDPCTMMITSVVATDNECSADPQGNGSIMITASCTSCAGAIEYSIDGNNYFLTNTFNDLSNGSYSVYVREAGNTTCNAISSATINAVPDVEFPVFTNCPATAITTTVDNGICGAVVNYSSLSVTDNCDVLPFAPPGTSLLGEFNNHFYFISNAKVNIQSAINTVDAIPNGYLTTINDAQENTYIFDQLVGLGGNLADHYSWIGYNDTLSEGNFVWFNGETATYTNWISGEPNAFNPDEDFTVMAPDFHPSIGTWLDSGAFPTIEYKYIVEIDDPYTQTDGLASGSQFPLGTTINTFVTTDRAGNTSSCSFDVVILDNVPPVAICQDVTLSLDQSGNAVLDPGIVNLNSTDNCTEPGNLTFQLSKTNFDCSDIVNNNAQSGWEIIGTAGFSSGVVDYTSLAFYGGEPYVAFRDNANGDKTSVVRYDGSNWVYVGSPGISSGNSIYQSLAFFNNQPHVAFRDVANGNGTSVMKYDGANWVYVGAQSFTPGFSEYNDLVVNNGELFLAFRDFSIGGRSSLMKYNGTNWVYVGIPGFSPGQARHQSLEFYNNEPFMAFEDLGNGSRTSVMKFDGTNWTNVGNLGFSGGNVNHVNLAIHNGEPHVVFQDITAGFKTSVMKYDGSTWGYVGTRGFSTLGGQYQKIEFINGTPYVAYRDDSNSGKATVMRYNGTSWEVVGTPGVSTGQSNHLDLAILNGEAYISYSDGGIAGKAAVQKYAQAANVITLTVTDESGNQAQCSAQVIVVDNMGPNLSCPTVAASYNVDQGECDYTATFVATAVDGCTASPLIEYRISGNLISFPYDFPVGTTTVDVSAMDDYGNPSMCSFDVVVVDNEAPILNCPPVNTNLVALDFDNGDYVNGQNNALPQGNNPRTIEGWFRSTNTVGFEVIYNYGVTVANQRASLMIQNGGGKLYYAGQNNDLVGNTVITDGLWHHVAATFDGTTLKLYVDGVEETSKSTTFNTNGFNYDMGRRAGANSEFLDGHIDELRVWNYARSQVELNQYMNIPLVGDEVGLVAYYDFEEGDPENDNSGIIALMDKTGNGNGTLQSFDLMSTTSNFISTNPGIQVNGIMHNTDPGVCYKTLDLSATASDNCTGSPAITYKINNTPISFPYNFPLGTTTVDYTATDLSGLSSSCSIMVTIEDMEAPSITCPVTDPSYNVDLGECDYTATFQAIATDACDNLVDISYEIGGNSISFPYDFPVGTSTVDVTAIDDSGNTSQCSFDVVVVDNIFPTASNPADIDLRVGASIPGPAHILNMVPEANQYEFVYQEALDGQLLSPSNYDVDNTAALSGVTFDRIAYYLELDHPTYGQQWLWVSMDDYTGNSLNNIGFSFGPVYDQLISNMNVYTNVPGIITGNGITTGNIEIWSNNYAAITNNSIGGSETTYDFDDIISGGINGYGCFQIHNYGSGETLLAVNAYNYGLNDGGSWDVEMGIGNAPTGPNPDWTFLWNGKDYTLRNFYAFVRDPLNANVCNSSIPTPDINVVIDESDNCPSITVAHDNDSTPTFNGCTETTIRTYSVTDASGNTTYVTQNIIREVDNTPPTASNPAMVHVANSGLIPNPDPLVVTDESDDCGTPTVTFIGDVSDGNSNPEIITRTYRVTDSCDNFIDVNQIIMVGCPTAYSSANGNQLNGLIMIDTTYATNGIIETNQMIISPQVGQPLINYNGGSGVLFLPGFEAKTGSVVTAVNDGCVGN